MDCSVESFLRKPVNSMNIFYKALFSLVQGINKIWIRVVKT